MTAKIYHADLFGSRASKYAALYASDLGSIAWQELSPNAPFYLFRPQEQELRDEYEQGWKITEVFPVNVLGFQTHRDHFAIDFEEEALKRRIENFRDSLISENEIRVKYTLGSWNFTKPRLSIQSDAIWQKSITKVQYRPFDTRFCYYHNNVVDRPRPELIKSMVEKNNWAMNITRQTRAEAWQHVLVSNLPTPAVFIEIKDGSSVFPLWLYPTEAEAAMGIQKEANLSTAFVKAVAERVGETPAPEEIFHYAYAVFHAPAYRERYAPFLKIDFPRLPLPADADSFRALAAIGAGLVALHLLEAPELNRHGIGFPVAGDHVVKKMRAAERYLPPEEGKPGRVRLNATETFENVPPEAWEYRVGGYQPAFKWLDDRAGRALSEADIAHYRKTLAALRETARLLPEADAAFRRMQGL